MEPKGPKRKPGWKSILRISPKDRTATPSQPQPTSRATTTTHEATQPNSLASKYGTPGSKAISSGATASIILSTHPVTNTTYAIKRFRRRHAVEEERSYARKIIAEHYIGSRLHHRNIIQTLDLFEEAGVWYEVMEYVPTCLFDRVQSGQMQLAEMTCTFQQLLAGMTYMHSRGFAHRDLKLENAVVSADGIVKIIDFGSATVCRDGDGDVSSGGVVGCLPYMAPELLHSRQYSAAKADVWSLAIIYCCMVLGRFPWKAAERNNDAFSRFAATGSRSSSRTQSVRSCESTSMVEEISRPSSIRSCDSCEKTQTTVTVISISLDEEKPEPLGQVLGPWSLLQQLPSKSRDVIGAMLTRDPGMRPALDHISRQDWIVQTQICSQDRSELPKSADGHVHR